MGTNPAKIPLIRDVSMDETRSVAVCVRGADASDLLAMLQETGLNFSLVDAADADVTFVDHLSAHDLSGTTLIVPVRPLAADRRTTAELLGALLSEAAELSRRVQKQEEEISALKSALRAARDAHASLDGDLAEAKKLQQSLLRDRGVSIGSVTLSQFLQSSGHVGGDLVGHFPVDGRYLGFFAIDVSGHGITSALMAARLAGYLSAGAAQANIALDLVPDGPEPRDPAEVVTEFNTLVLEDLETEHYFTLLLGFVDSATGLVRVCQAGHPHPVLVHADGRQTALGAGGLPVGLIPGADYETFEVQLNPGDRLVVLSDGFIEAELPEGGFLGDSGLANLLTDTSMTSIDRMLDALVWRLSQLCGDAGFNDDLSGIAIEYRRD